MRIALLNCYLQGHTENAETESTARFIEAARRLGIEAGAFARSEDLHEFKPDFVLALSYNDAKLTEFPTYVLLTMPVEWIQNLPRVLRNVLSFDGYWTVAPSVSEFVGALYTKAGKPDLGAFAAISYARTEFVPLDFRRAWAAYLGTNWDGNRHGEIFRALAPLGVAKFYGKRERWSHLPADAWGGEVPFDGVSVLGAYRRAGIGLCMNHPDFDAEGIPTSRTFEVPAASAAIIAARNRLVEETFGDAALYVDTAGAPGSAADQIREHVEWIRAHPKRASEMAEAGHRIFNERFALEAFLANALAMHRDARPRLGFVPTGAARPRAADQSAAAFAATVLIGVGDDSLRHFPRCLDSVLAQALPPTRIVLMDGTVGATAADTLRAPGAAAIEHRRVPRGGPKLARLLARAEADVASEWVCCISAEEVLYPNHLFAVAEAARRHRRRHGAPPAILYSGMAQISEAAELPELMNDRYNVTRAEHMRLAQFDFAVSWKSITRLPLHPASCVWHVPALRRASRPRWLTRLFPSALSRRLGSLAKGGGIAFTGAVTLATSSSRAYTAFGQFTAPRGPP